MPASSLAKLIYIFSDRWRIINTVLLSVRAPGPPRPSPPLSLIVFTTLLAMQTRSSDRDSSVRLSVCLSNAWIVTKRKTDVSRLLYHTKKHLAYSFLRKRPIDGGGATPSTWNFGPTSSRCSEIADFEPFYIEHCTWLKLSSTFNNELSYRKIARVRGHYTKFKLQSHSRWHVTDLVY